MATIQKQSVESLDVFHSFFEQSADSILILENGIFTDCNQATVQMMRATDKAQFLSVHPSRLSPEHQPDGRPSGEKADEMIRVALEKGSNRFEWVHRRLDGEDFPVEVLLTPVSIGNRQVIHTVWRDITERKRAEILLKESADRLNLIVANALDAVISIDSEGVVIGWNPQAETTLGWLRDEAMGKSLGELIVPNQHRESHRLGMKHYLATGAGPVLNKRIEITAQHRDGHIFPIELSIMPVEVGNSKIFTAFLRDITERKQLEQQIQESYERRGRQVQISTQISQSIAASSSLEELYKRVVAQVKELFGYYHSQILRYEPAQNAVVLVVGYGEVGAKMLGTGHRMPMGTGLIGTAAATGETVLRPFLQNDPDWKANPLLPNTKGEVAVPIKMGDEILGVLDVQSDQAGALSSDDQLLLEGLCGQIAVAIESTRLRQEMSDRLDEISRLYQAMRHEGWQAYKQNENRPTGFMFDETGIISVDRMDLTGDSFADIPINIPGGEAIGSLAVADDPEHPLSAQERDLLGQIAEQIALALESARLFDQTQSALAQSEKLFNASRRLTQSDNLQNLVLSAVEALDIREIDRAFLGDLDYSSTGELTGMTLIANWAQSADLPATPVGTHYPKEILSSLSLFTSTEPLFFNDMWNDERIDETTLALAKRVNYRSVAALPLYVGSRQDALLLFQGRQPHTFTSDEIRLFTTLAPQLATVLENRRQFEHAQEQAKREAMLNAISQKIQSATSVEAVLQIAARELGHALGAPMTVAQLSMKDKSS